MLPSERCLTFHAYEQQIGGQLPPATLSLLLINPVPVKTQEVHDNLPAHSVIERLLQIQPMFPKKKISLVHVHTVPWHGLPTSGTLSPNPHQHLPQRRTTITRNLTNMDSHRTESLLILLWTLFNTKLLFLFLLTDFLEREGSGGGGEGEREREPWICCSTYLCIYWLLLVCALTGDQTSNLGISGQRSNQLSYPAKLLILEK